MKYRFLIDFDSTLIKLESLEVLAEVALGEAPDRTERLEAISSLTARAMNGEMSFGDALLERLALLDANRRHLADVVERLQHNVSDSFLRNRDFLRREADRVFIVSGGFRSLVEPVAKQLGLRADHVHANDLVFDEHGKITGCDASNPLAHDGGKVMVARKLGGDDLVVVGDGWGDYEIHAAGAAKRFYAFTENAARARVTTAAKRVAPSFDEVLYDCGLKSSVSYPKNRIEVLLLENIHDNAVQSFTREGYRIRSVPTSLDADALREEISRVSILGIRSKTQVNATLLEEARQLVAVGAFCIGTNQIDLAACARAGVAVFNAPFSNTRSVVELAIAEIILLMRNLPEKMRAMHAGEWKKSARGSFEVRGKTLGIVGYGNIGMQLSVLAEALGMNVRYYDLQPRLALGTARSCASLRELLEASDVVTLHVDGRPENRGLFGREEFAKMREGALFLNLARGHVVDHDALHEAVAGGRIRGAGVDVFPEEPAGNDQAFESVLRGLGNVLLTPHIGGSTLEAQADIGRFVADKLVGYINTGSTMNSVNFPELQLPEFADAHRLIHVHHNVPGVVAEINGVLARDGINVVGQYLKTNEYIGYAITDVDKADCDPVLADLKRIEHTIRARTLY
ncbi:MAG: phosphoglycerate dehydrogenase [Gammaproteobacteria bacterium]|nr:phosphoglycerate dehydrogenase [Gammaproteobacteria bacterium]